MQTLHLFAGAGGGLLADLILGHRPIAAVEWDAYACQVLRERSADGWFPDLHVHEGDIQLFDPSEYAGRVDCIHAGFPCQDLSVAGKGAGLSEGTRSGLYREVLRVADVVRPRYIFMENVAAILNRGLGVVLGDLSTRGYSARWVCLRASDVGARHHRDRWWLLAKRADTDSQRQQQPQRAISESGRRTGDMGETGNTTDAGRQRRNNRINHRQERHIPPDQKRHATQDQPERHRRQPRTCPKSHARSDVPNTNNTGTHRSTTQPQQTRITVTEDVYAAEPKPSYWEVEPELGRLADGVANRIQRLKALGNGQVPLQAATAFRILEQLF